MVNQDNKFIFLHQSGAQVKVNIQELVMYLELKDYKPDSHTKEQLVEIIRQDKSKYKIQVEQIQCPITGLYQGKDIIIGGGSEFLNTFEDGYLQKVLAEQIVIGCNYWVKHFPCDWTILLDSMADITLVEEIIYHQKCKLALNNITSLSAHLRKGADLAFRAMGNSAFTKDYKGYLRRGLTGTSAIHLACYMGAKNILLLGVDLKGGHVKNWSHKLKIDYDKTYNDTAIHNLNFVMNEIISYYGVNIYQANPKARTNIPIKSLEEFINNEEKDIG